MVANDDSIVSSLWVRFRDEGSEDSFEALVRKHVDLVFSVALRRCAGEAALAKDVVQVVFSDLARKAPHLPRNLVLAGWLYRHASFVSSTMVRSECRRRVRESRAMDHQLESQPDMHWDRLGPVLDDALDELHESDRNAIILRYLDSNSFRDVGAVLGVSADAARMRVDRALERLRERLQTRGITSTATAVGLVIGQHGIVAAPAGLASSVGASALLASGSAATQLVTVMTATKTYLALAAIVAAGATTVSVVEHRRADALRAELANLAGARTAPDTSTDPASGTAIHPAELEALRSDRLKLLALRDEVGRLREEQSRLKHLAGQKPEPTVRGVPTTPEEIEAAQREYEKELDRGLGYARLHFAKAWMNAIYEYASKNEGRVPESFADAQQYLSKGEGEEEAAVGILDPSRFEIVHKGSLDGLAHPNMTIVLREREPFLGVPDESGKRLPRRTYGFADGHSEIYSAPDGDFEKWESSRRAP